MIVAMLITALLGLDDGVAAALVLGAPAVGAIVMGWALVAGSVHYATDALAGFCVAVAVIPAVVWRTDLLADRAATHRGGCMRPGSRCSASCSTRSVPWRGSGTTTS
jgi:undecaprenyl-diphosphatase